MKAVIFEKPGVMKVKNVDKPVCPEGGMLVKVSTCAICSTDVHMHTKGHRALKYPVIPGHEIAGTVAEISSQCGVFEVGDRVVVGPGVSCGACRFCLSGRENLCDNIRIIGFNHPGGMAEYIAVPREMIKAEWVVRIPADMSLEVAALSEPVACCINGLEKIEIERSQRIFIVGGGPIGCLLSWLSKSSGAREIVIAEKNSWRRSRVKELGVADIVVEDMNDIDSFDVIILACRVFPKSELLNEKLEKGGQILFFSGVAEDLFDSFSWIPSVHYKEWKVAGAYGCRPDQIKKAVELLHNGVIPVEHLIDARYSLDTVDEAFEIIKRKACLKAVITFEGS